jgi:hypothetical protein
VLSEIRDAREALLCVVIPVDIRYHLTSRILKP